MIDKTPDRSVMFKTGILALVGAGGDVRPNDPVDV